MTQHYYDDTGRLTHSVSSREPEWDADEVATLLASRMQSIGRHGISMDQATDPANAGRFRTHVTRDYAQQTLNATQKALRDNPRYKHDDHDSLLWRVELLPEDGDSDI